MSNFLFLTEKSEYALFAPACVEAEKIYASAPAMCAVGCRKALELAVKWVYSADKTMKMPYKDNLQSLIHEPSFRFAVDSNTWGKLPFIIKLGNLAVHTERSVQPSDALASLKGLFEFVQWIDYCYGSDYQERVFDESLIPTEKIAVDTRKIKEQESLLDEKEAEIEALRNQIEQMSAQYTAEKEKHQQERSFQPEDLSEFQTRKIYIDVDLKFMGWKFTGTDADVQEEYPVQGMAGVVGQMGYCDYVLFGKDGLPLAVIEAKRTSKDPNIGRKQAVLYADCLERKFGRRPMMFTTNGFETYYWDDQSGPQRKVSGVFSKEDLQKLMNRRTERQDLMSIPIDDKITDRYYQKEATHAHILSGILKCPCCGKSLYGNIAKAHSKDKKTRYYYYCKNTVTSTGHECTFRLNIEQTEINRMVASIISAMVSDPRFADAIKAKIGSAVDTNDLEKQLEALQAQLRQTLGTKTRLERQMDGLDVNDPYYDRKISDLQRRYDEQYGRIDEIEVQIDDVQSQIRSIRQKKISGDNIYRLLLAFDQVYEAASEVERKEFMRAFIERIELFPEKQPDGNWIRKIIFNFPVPVNGAEVKELPLENETMVETVVLMSKVKEKNSEKV